MVKDTSDYTSKTLANDDEGSDTSHTISEMHKYIANALSLPCQAVCAFAMYLCICVNSLSI